MINRHSIGFRVAVLVAGAVTLLLGAFAVFLIGEVRGMNERDEIAKLKGTNALILRMVQQTDAILRQNTESWAQSFAASVSGSFTLEKGENPVLRLNGVALNGNTREVDAFSQGGSGKVATIFARKGDDFVRITTSVKKEDGSRAVGTSLGKQSPAYPSVMEGKAYVGRATLFGRQYMTKYAPVRDAGGEIVGVLFVGVDIGPSLEFLRETIRSVKLGETGYAYVLDARPGNSAGTLLVHPSAEGQNIAASTDADGRPFIKEILERRSGLIRYPWLNKQAGEVVPRGKIVAFDEYKDWNVIVASGSYEEEIFSLATHVQRILVVATVGLIALLLAILGVFLRMAVIKPLDELVEVSGRVAEGDLTVAIETGKKDEIGQVMAAMQRMATKLASVIGEVRQAADTIAGASQSMSTTADEISVATERQSQSTASSAAALEEVTVSINEVSKLAKETEESSERTSSLSSQSVTAIHSAVDEIESMASGVRSSSEQVDMLLRRSEEIGGIANVIRDIADQTNLLALNAAIEAARAGETGRGFAVVADEVRKLAERTTQATHDIAAEIRQIQDETRTAVDNMRAVTPKIQDGLSRVNEVSALLDTIDGEAGESRRRAIEVADATRGQALAANEIAGAVEKVAQMTAEPHATICSNAENAAQLQAMAERLRAQVGFFKT